MAFGNEQKRSISELTNEFRVFWESLFDHLDIHNQYFSAKLCYMGKEFGDPIECVRFFAGELSSGKDLYVELFDWNTEYFFKNTRTLLKLKHDPDWKSKPYIYKETKSSISTITYTIKVEMMELINETTSSALVPIIKKKITAPVPEESVETFDDSKYRKLMVNEEDLSFSNMTMRDFYCFIQNVPCSNKAWVNKIIEDGINYKLNMGI